MVEFLSQTSGHTVFLTRAEAVVAGGGDTAPIRLRLVGANPQTELRGVEPLPGKVGYYRGHNSAAWQVSSTASRADRPCSGEPAA